MRPSPAVKAGAEAYAVLTTAVQQAADDKVLNRDIDAGVATIAAWSAVHGVASLILDGVVGVRAHERRRAEDLARRVVEVAVRGLAA
jgi:hypothetical protein